jgi:O-antigen/teichoic acid export membrane protein
MKVGLSVLRSEERIGTLSLREFLSALWLVFSVILSYILEMEIEKLILLCLIGDTILVLWIFVQIGVSSPLLSFYNTLAEVKPFLRFSSPLIIASLFLWFTQSIDRFLIVHTMGLPVVAIYGVALQISHLVSIVLNPINFVLFPRVATSWNLEQRDEVNYFFSQAVSLTLILSTPIIVGVLVMSDELILLLAGQNYASSKGIIFFLLLSALASMIYQNHLYVIHLMEKTYLLPLIFVCTGIINFILCYYLIRSFGIIGAAVGRCSTLIIMAIIVTIWARKYIKFRVSWNLIVKGVVVSLIMGAMISLLPKNTWFYLCFTAVIGSIVYFFLLIIFKIVIFDRGFRLNVI